MPDVVGPDTCRRGRRRPSEPPPNSPKTRQKIGRNRSRASERRTRSPSARMEVPANAHEVPSQVARPRGFEPLTFGSVDRGSRGGFRALAEYVAEPRAVTEPLKLRAERRTVRPILRTWHVPHVCLPAARVAPALQTRPTAAPDRWGILVAVEAVERRNVAQQTVAPLVGVRAVHNQPKRPTATRDGAPEVPPNVRILGRAEDQPLHTIWSYAFAGPATGCLAARGRRSERDRQEREYDGQQPAHMRERSRHTGRATRVRAVRFPYCADTARDAERSPKAPGDDRSTSHAATKERPATRLD